MVAQTAVIRACSQAPSPRRNAQRSRQATAWERALGVLWAHAANFLGLGAAVDACERGGEATGAAQLLAALAADLARALRKGRRGASGGGQAEAKKRRA